MRGPPQAVCRKGQAVNIFVVHSGCDADKVKEAVEQLEALESRVNILVLKNGGVFWKIEAEQLLKKSQMILFVVGENSHKSRNIDWELKKAVKFNKLILYYKLEAQNKLNRCLFGVDRFSKKEALLAEEAKTVADIAHRVQKYENGEYMVFNRAVETIDRNELLEQYKIFLETSESLIARRQTVNSFYVSANTALITIMGGLIAVFSETGLRAILLILTSVVGIILSVSWIGILNSYGVLNGSKMKVISMIEHELPAALYDTEWSVMSDKLNSKKYSSFTDSEKKAPKAFVSLYLLLIAVAVLMGISLLL